MATIHEVYPYLRVHGTAEAIDFYGRAFGAAVVRPLQNQFYGERSGTVRDPFGHERLLGGRIESVSQEEMQRRRTAMFNRPQ